MNWKLFLSLILLLGLILRIKFFIGLNWSDDVGYVYLANQVLDGTFKPSYMASLRLMMIFPLAFFFYLFGISNFSAALYPLILSLGNIVLTFLIGKLLFNEKAGLIGALLMAFYPLDVNYATWIMPDVPITFFTGLSVFMFLIGEKKNSRKFLLLSGIFAGLAYLLKLSGLLVFVFFVSYYSFVFLFKRKIPSNFLFILLGYLIVFLVEGSYYYLTTKDFFLQFNVGFKYFAERERLKYEFLTDLTYYPKIMFNLDNNFSFQFKNYYTYFGIFYYLVVFSIIFLPIKKVKNSYVLILWFLSIFLYMQFGPMSYKEYIPMHRLDRHLTILSIPSILILSAFLEILRKRVKFLFIVTLVFLCGSFLFYIKNIYKLQIDATKDTKLIFEELKKLPEKTVYSDGGTIGHLMFYSKFRKNHLYKPLDFRSCEELKDSYVIVNATRGWIEFSPMLKNYPLCVFERPNNWILLKTIKSDATSYPYNLFDPQIFYVS